MSIVDAPPGIDRDQIVRTLRLLDHSHRIEIRSLTKPILSRTGTAAEIEELADTAAKWARAGRNVYYCLNPVRDDYRDEKGRAVRDADIVGRRRLMLDGDSVREDGEAPASDEEQDAARRGLALAVNMLRDMFRFPSPLMVVDTGNGTQAIYETDLPADEPTTDLVKRFLAAVPKLVGGKLFTGCQIDPVVSNLSRLARLGGTINHKPKADDERPNRPARIIKVNEACGIVTEDMLREVVTEAEELEGQGSGEPDPPPGDGIRVNGSLHAGLRLAASSGEAAYIRAALTGECDKIRSTQPGGRHKRIRSGARAIGGFIHLDKVPRSEMLAALVAAAVATGKTEEEATKVIEWGLDRGEEKPRKIPEPEPEANGKHHAGSKGGHDQIGPEVDPASWQLDVRKASDYQIRPIKFLSKPRLPRGIVITLAGAGGEGKSTLVEHVAADLSRSRPTLGSEVAYPEPVGVLMLACEDGREDALVPRLVAAGADLDRVRIVEGLKDGKGGHLPFDITHLPYLRRHIEEGNAEGRNYKLVVIDPITTYVGRAKVDDHRDAQLKPAMDGLARIAQDLDITFACLAHLNKSGNTKTAAARVMGGGAYVTSARLTYIYGTDPEDPARRILASPKANIPGGKPPSLAMRIGQLPEPEALALLKPYVEHLADDDRRELAGQLYRLTYDGSVETTAEDLLDAGFGKEGGRKEKAIDFLREILADGKFVPSNTVYEEGKNRRISRSAIWDAKSELKVNACKVTEAGITAWHWQWTNPDETPL